VKELAELLNLDDPALPLLKQWIGETKRPVELLPPGASRAEALLATQVTTRSTLGAVVYETGGILIDHGWLRVLGSGHPRLSRTLPDWNRGRSKGFLLVADDVVGGFFAINGGTLGPDVKHMYYFAPDTLDWEPMKMGYTEFVQWAMSERLDAFYDWIRWPDWQNDVTELSGDRGFIFIPLLFTREGKDGSGKRSDVPMEELWDFAMDVRTQLGPRPTT
jgi:hypothetical protein